MTPLSTSLPVTPATAGNATPRQKIGEVAKQFEAILLRQMLADARKTDFGGNALFGKDQGMSTFRQMQDDRFADIAAQQGSFGLAKMIEAQLARILDPGTPAAGDASTPTKAG